MKGAGAGFAALLAVLAVAAYSVLIVLHAPPAGGSQDVYAYFLPNVLYALEALAQGGRGLLWNPFQGFGHPFFANPVSGLLYPPHLAFLLLDPLPALDAVLVFNLFCGAAGMFCLCREIGLGRVASFGGALAFEIGFPTAYLAAWSPMHVGSWIWLPWALFFCERVLRTVSAGAVLGLAAVLALQILPGFVLIAALTYQLIAVRLAWEILTRRDRRSVRAALAAAVGLALAPLLAALQIAPALEYAGQSIRTAVADPDILRWGHLGWRDALADMARRGTIVPFLIAPLALAASAPLAAATRRHAVFYLLAGAVYALLGFGNATPLFDLYLRFPPGAAAIRVPYRMFWMTGFCLTALAALAFQGLAEARGRRAAAVVLFALLLGAAAPGGLRGAEIVALALLALAAVAALTARLGAAAAWLAIAAVAANLAAVPERRGGALNLPLERLYTYAPTFAELRARIGQQGRVFLIPDLRTATQYRLMQKTATLLRVPHIYDYEGLPELRVAEYFAVMRKGSGLLNSTEAYLPLPVMPPQFRRRLLDLAAVQYVVAAPTVAEVEQVLALPRVALAGDDLRIYRNDGALRRARFVPRVEVVADARALLQRLADGGDDLAALALVEEAPPDGFSGGGAGRGEVRFAVDEPERLVLEVDATARGFLFVADQYYPGWRATVNGAATPIQRANYLFRLIEVRAGASRVELLYQPGSVRLGGAISAAALLIFAAVLVRTRRPRRATTVANALTKRKEDDLRSAPKYCPP